jgi:hypothetical protein
MSNQPISQLIRSARRQLGLSQYALADQLATVSGKQTMGRDRVARWERGRQIPRREWRQWLAVVLRLSPDQLDAGAEAARRQHRVGQAVTLHGSASPSPTRRSQGTPALLPVFRSRVQAGILAATLLNPHRAFSLTELADHAGGSLASVSKESRLLEAAGILTTRHEGAIRLIRAATDKPMLPPLTELIRVTYGVPQILGEEFGRVQGVARITLTGTWAERFAGVTGPDPETIHVRLTPQKSGRVSQQALSSAARRAERRLRRTVRVQIAPILPAPIRSRGAAPLGSPGGGNPIPRQRDGWTLVQVVPLPSPDGSPPTEGSWSTGADIISRLVDDGQLELFSGPDTDAKPYFDLAAQHLSAADDALSVSPVSAFVLICQAAQVIGVGLLAAQGLRPTAGSTSDAMSRAVVAQFGPQYGQIELLRQRLSTLTHPTGRDNRVTEIDVGGCLPAVRSLLKAADDVSLELSLFG